MEPKRAYQPAILVTKRNAAAI
jgi:hypothetical protein